MANPFKHRRSETWGYIASVTVGAVGWAYLAADVNGRPAWDSSLYFSMFVPLQLALAAALGFFFPYRPWRWGALLVGAQAVVALVMHPFTSIVAVGLTLLMVQAVAAVALSYAGGFAQKIALRQQGRRL